MSPYVTSKWAVMGLARTLQAEVSGHDVSLLSPGGVDTEIYQRASSFLGVQGAPPPPVSSAARTARAAVELLDRPRRQRHVGAANTLMTWGFRLLPPVYDVLVGPLMKRLALDDSPVADHRGNLYRSASAGDPEPEPTPLTREEN